MSASLFTGSFLIEMDFFTRRIANVEWKGVQNSFARSSLCTNASFSIEKHYKEMNVVSNELDR
jgi:hypothetical protein